MIVIRLMNRVDDEVQRKHVMHVSMYLQCSSSLLSHQSCKRECLSAIVVKASLILEKKPKNGRSRFNHGFILVFLTFFPISAMTLMPFHVQFLTAVSNSRF